MKREVEITTQQGGSVLRVVVSGPQGGGKSRLALLIALLVRQHGYDVTLTDDETPEQGAK